MADELAEQLEYMTIEELHELPQDQFQERYEQARTQLLKNDFPDAGHLVDQLGEDIADQIMSHITTAMHLFGVSKKRLETGIGHMRTGQHHAIESIDETIRDLTEYDENYNMIENDATYNDNEDVLTGLIKERRLYNQRYAEKVKLVKHLSQDYPNNYNFTPISLNMNYP
jgi:hypothetical protein